MLNSPSSFKCHTWHRNRGTQESKGPHYMCLSVAMATRPLQVTILPTLLSKCSNLLQLPLVRSFCWCSDTFNNRQLKHSASWSSSLYGWSVYLSTTLYIWCNASLLSSATTKLASVYYMGWKRIKSDQLLDPFYHLLCWIFCSGMIYSYFSKRKDHFPNTCTNFSWKN